MPTLSANYMPSYTFSVFGGRIEAKFLCSFECQHCPLKIINPTLRFTLVSHRRPQSHSYCPLPKVVLSWAPCIPLLNVYTIAWRSFFVCTTKYFKFFPRGRATLYSFFLFRITFRELSSEALCVQFDRITNHIFHSFCFRLLIPTFIRKLWSIVPVSPSLFVWYDLHFQKQRSWSPRQEGEGLLQA